MHKDVYLLSQQVIVIEEKLVLFILLVAACISIAELSVFNFLFVSFR